VGGSIAANGNDLAIARRRGTVGRVSAMSGLENFQIDSFCGAAGGAPLPERAGAAITGDRVDDYEWARIRLAFSTSRAICCCNAGTVANRFSARSRWTNDTVSSRS